MSWIYIVAVIIFAIVSNVNKATKNKPKGAPRGGMPTFGGGGEDRPVRHNKGTDASGGQSGSGFPDPTTILTRDYDASPAFPEPAYTPTPDYVTGEGVSLEQAEEDDGVEQRTQRMEEEVRRLQAAFDGIAGSDHKVTKGTKNASARSANQLNGTDSRDALRNGVIWAEILGPPRARKPHSSRR